MPSLIISICILSFFYAIICKREKNTNKKITRKNKEKLKQRKKNKKNIVFKKYVDKIPRSSVFSPLVIDHSETFIVYIYIPNTKTVQFYTSVHCKSD